MLDISRTSLPGVVVLTPKRFGDERGFFAETWNQKRLQDHAIWLDFVQDNHSFSREAGTIRGLHFQAPPHAQDKLVRCARGRLLDVAVDIRTGSPTFGQWVAQELSFDNGRQMLIPAGFLHGFITREPDTEIAYKCTGFYAPECEGSVRWDDPEIGIEWGIGDKIVMSEKDRLAGALSDLSSPFVYKGPLPWEGAV
ncbi:MAG TPA: dTDP-4-dehydrorhamnose 3,5-epimerase [Aliiroseovarius sp.]|nr:dTDP-4-dehydrorhamnose 3,5-epimerase [Aliiroseovarius sp.]